MINPFQNTSITQERQQQQRHCRHQGTTLPVPAAVSGSPTRKCGLLPQHFHHRVNAVVWLSLEYFTLKN